jgi:hypothetical protein
MMHDSEHAQHLEVVLFGQLFAYSRQEATIPGKNPTVGDLSA